MTEQDIIKEAKRMALAKINKDREMAGYRPMNRIQLLWWDLYGVEWIDKAKAQVPQP